jgi:hypothetical protein
MSFSLVMAIYFDGHREAAGVQTTFASKKSTTTE